ncbi:MAG: NnrS family protein [Candidatus Omnitrophica bacterium]|nr:NnrS family protein [Candidatus Omnitrophota bacterium]
MVSWSDLRREPFRLFFPLGILGGLVGSIHWLAYAAGWTSSSGFYHASIQVGAYMSLFIVGFLLTALPRFTSAPPATSAELIVILALCLAQPLCLSLGYWIAGEACFMGILLALAAFALRRVARRRAEVSPPTEFVWIPIGILHGLTGTSLLILGQAGLLPAWALAVGRPMAQQGFLFSIVIGVGGFMAPRLMGRGMLPATPTGVSEAHARRVRMRRVAWHVVAGLVFFTSFWVEGRGAVGWAYRLRALLLTVELAWTSRFYLPPASPERYVRFLWVSLWMIVIGFWGAGLAMRFRVAMLHLAFLGGLSLMTFAVATMVVLSHAGEGWRLRQPLWVLRVIGAGIAVAIAARLAADFMPNRFFTLLGLAAFAWSAAGVSWFVFALPFVVRQVSSAAFDEMHEEAKRRLLK